MPESGFNAELRLARFLPRAAISRRTLGPIRKLTGSAGRKPPRGGTIVPVNGGLSVRVFRPATERRATPGLLWIHGGGYLIGTAAMGDQLCRQVAATLGIVAASVEYRLAPEHQFPAPLEDCYAGLRWLAEQPDVDRARIAIGGESAGGGLAAALALLAKERGEVRPAFQLLSYPMLDDRTTTRTDIDPRGLRMWNQAANRLGWSAYLGDAANGDVPPLAAPARYEDLAGLPPAWLGVGTKDLFHDEDLAYAERLRQAGVPCTLHVVPGAYHGFDTVESRAGVSRAYREAKLAALAEGLGVNHRAA